MEMEMQDEEDKEEGDCRIHRRTRFLIKKVTIK